MQQPVLNFMPQSHILHIVIICWYYCFGIIFLSGNTLWNIQNAYIL